MTFLEPHIQPKEYAMVVISAKAEFYKQFADWDVLTFRANNFAIVLSRTNVD